MACFRFKTSILVFTSTLSFWANADLVVVPRKFDKEMEKISSWTPDHFSHPEYTVGYLDDASLIPERITRQSMRLDEKLWAFGGYNPKNFSKQKVNIERIASGYHDYEQLTAFLNARETQFPTLFKLQSAGKSVDGRELWYGIISKNNLAVPARPKMIFHANMHGDEVVGRELMLYLIDHLLGQYGKNVQITQLLDNAEVYIMPSINPDGFELQSRANSNGRDLNRDFPDKFQSPSDTPAGREVEVAHIMQLAKENHFIHGINWHGGAVCLNLPWDNIQNKPENKYSDDALIYALGREYTENNAPMHNNHQGNFDHGLTYGWEWYPVFGGIEDWFNYYRESIQSLVELSSVKWPSASTLDGYWADNQKAMVTYLWRGLRGVHLLVKDQAGNEIKNTEIEVASAPKRVMKFQDSSVHRMTLDGLQKVKISANGFKSQNLEIEASYFDGKYRNVVLVR